GIGQDDVSRQALIFRAKTVSEPGTERGPPRLGKAGVHEPDGRFVAVDVRVHGPDHSDIVDDACEMGQELGDVSPALAVLLKFPWTDEQLLGRAVDEAEGDFP